MKTKKILFRSIKFILYIFIILLHYSCQNPPATENNDDNDTIPNAMPQEHIPWPSLADSPWPMYKHDPQLTGRSSFSGPSEGVTDWVYSPEDGYMSESGIVIGLGSTLYFGDATGGNQDSGNLVALSAGGNLKWKFNIEGHAVTNTPLVRFDGSILIGSWSGKFYAINTDGTILWQYDAGSGIYTETANIDKIGNIYFTTRDGSLISLTPKGEERFRQNFGEYRTAWGIAFAPNSTHLYVGVRQSGLFAVDTTGNVLWTYETEQGSIWSIPAVDSQGNVYFIWTHRFWQPDSLAHAVVCLDPEGDVRWSFPFGEYPSTPGIGLTIDNNGHIYFSNWTEKILYALHYNGTLKWSFDMGDSLGTGQLDTEFICDSNDQIYFGSSFDSYYSFTGDGSFRWSYNVGDVQFSFNPPAIGANGMMYVITLKWPHKIFAFQ
ncbi:MAG: PQQ-binding-like beta-propeller repeat protein [Candidatus Neomarinimicrobiota bacterium]|jgi:outer membrane protein assembly factor BamB|nr:PQQ-binding-like beta-propeller repeat protein [Candidatus Neomarinimicrobiota bacterium]